jgi:hypothetical protein
MDDLLLKYDVQFQKQQSVNNTVYHVATGGGLAEYLSSYTDPESIREGLLNVDYYLNGGSSDYEKCTVSGELYTAWLDNKTADIYSSTGNTEHLLQSIPLKDFKSILLQWLDFLRGKI